MSSASGQVPEQATQQQDSRALGPWRRLLTASRRSSRRTRVVVAFLAVLLGLAVSTQVQQTRQQGLESLRQEDLISILDTVDQRAERLDAESRRLSQQQAQLEREQPGGPAAIQAARTRADTLAILAGTAPATGPGIRITVQDPRGVVGAPAYLDAVQELRDAGAEAIQVGTVRVVASTSFTPSGESKVSADGTELSSPVRILAVGDAQTLASAMNIPGGVVESVRGLGATITVEQADSVLVNALHRVTPPRYARPESTPASGSGS